MHKSVVTRNCGFADRRKKRNGRALTGAGAPHSHQSVKGEPWPACGYASPHPDQGLIHRPTNGGHCGGDGSVLRLRAAVARTNWRGLAA
jgi:hypothetical protein